MQAYTTLDTCWLMHASATLETLAKDKIYSTVYMLIDARLFYSRTPLPEINKQVRGGGHGGFHGAACNLSAGDSQDAISGRQKTRVQGDRRLYSSHRKVQQCVVPHCGHTTPLSTRYYRF